jgi:hypothetical protein
VFPRPRTIVATPRPVNPHQVHALPIDGLGEFAEPQAQGWLQSARRSAEKIDVKTHLLVLLLCAACSASLDNRKGAASSEDGTRSGERQGKLKFADEDMAAKYKAAKASPDNFELVTTYARAVALVCLASLIDTSCTSCENDLPTYRPRSELNTNYWPIIEDVLPMLEPFLNGKGLDDEHIELLVEVKGRLLWLAGRSAEEQTLIDSYALAHPKAVSIVKRRLELLREAGDVYLSESQCSRSRARTKTAPESARVELLTSCVALHPNNERARSDITDYADYLPNLGADEDALYRASLAQRCVEKVGDTESRCAEACACENKSTGKPASATCKRECGACRKGSAKQLQICKDLGAPVAVRPTRTARAKAGTAEPK